MASMDQKINIAVGVMRGLKARYNQDWVSPSVIGYEVGRILNRGSSYVGSPICKEAVKRGIMERSKRGHYRLVDD